MESWKALRDEALKKRWRERSVKYHALEKAEVEEEKMLRLSELTQTRESERAI